MNPNSTEHLQVDVDRRGPGVSSFSWMGVTRTPAEHQWCTGCRPILKTLIEDETQKPVYCFTTGDMEAINQLSLALVSNIVGSPSPNSPGNKLTSNRQTVWGGAQSLVVDRRAVVQFFGRQISNQARDTILNPTVVRIGQAHATSWIRWMTCLAWQNVPLPSWLGEAAGKSLEGGRTLGIEEIDIQRSFHPWCEKDDKGLHGDLAIFLTEFCSEAAEQSSPRLRHSLTMAKACVLLRALAVVDPIRMPAATMTLLDKTESLLDMAELEGAEGVDHLVYGVVRAAWDQKILRSLTEETTHFGRTGARLL